MNRITRIALLVGACLALAVVATGCGPDQGAVTDPGLLEGVWNLESYRDEEGALRDADDAYDSHLSLEQGMSRGVAAVNAFNGTYGAAADGSISFGPQSATLMAGAPPAMEQERGFFAALDAAAAFEISDSTLVLRDAEDMVVATFVVGE